jgi:hypothetical protein
MPHFTARMMPASGAFAPRFTCGSSRSGARLALAAFLCIIEAQGLGLGVARAAALVARPRRANVLAYMLQLLKHLAQ